MFWITPDIALLRSFVAISPGNISCLTARMHAQAILDLGGSGYFFFSVTRTGSPN